MNNEESFLNNLADFRDLKANKSNNEFSVTQSQSSHFLPQIDIELNHNDKLIKNFKELRDQLKQAHRHTHSLKVKLNEKDSELQRYRLSEKQYISQNYQLKNQLSQAKSTIQDSQTKLSYLKECAKGTTKMQEELEFLKIELNNYKNKFETLTEENNKIMEMSVLQKISLEEKINKLTAKQTSDTHYVQEVEVQLSKQREKTLKLQNQLRKAQIKYDEEIYNKKWLGGNFERQQLYEQVAQLEKQNQELYTKTKKEKQKRNALEKRVIELEEMTGLWSVKAEAYEIENKNILKKYKKIEKKMNSCKENADTQAAESLSWQQKFMKLFAIAEELISRVKRELYGDTVSLAKTCQFKMNKLKEEEKHFVKYTERKSPSICKKRQKSRALSKGHSPVIIEAKETPKGTMRDSDISEYTKTKQKVNFGNERRALFQDEKESQKGTYRTEESAPLVEIDNLQAKIRKQRESMEKKIKERMLYRKIEVANSPDRHKLREQYLGYEK